MRGARARLFIAAEHCINQLVFEFDARGELLGQRGEILCQMSAHGFFAATLEAFAKVNGRFGDCSDAGIDFSSRFHHSVAAFAQKPPYCGS